MTTELTELKDLILCECGCKSLIPRTDKQNRIRRFVFGHHFKGKKRNFSKEHLEFLKKGIIRASKLRTEESFKKARDKRKLTPVSEETKRKISLKQKGRKLSQETINKIKNAWKKNNWENRLKNPKVIRGLEKISKNLTGRILSREHINNIKKSKRELMNNKEYRDKHIKALMKGFLKRPTKPEKEFMKIIDEYDLKLKYVGNGEFWINGDNYSFNPDFINEEDKVIVEVFGKYWHTREDNAKKDILRLEAYKNRGFKTLILWDYELENKYNVIKKLGEVML